MMTEEDKENRFDAASSILTSNRNPQVNIIITVTTIITIITNVIITIIYIIVIITTVVTIIIIIITITITIITINIIIIIITTTCSSLEEIYQEQLSDCHLNLKQ
ncbi:hypothetical protein H671_4g13120 [Cricetulus griseus]|uniref:Uncharacterized protein n=1 Tax=Cricetulus griseus TaxID=10029 RepID=A0A061I2K5_CRIGR|nr:hypothetical protein H671_4g13120 [Cricetulus griseus]